MTMRSNTTPIFTSLVLAAAVAFAPSMAHAVPPPEPTANPSQDDLDRAKELFDNGKALYREGSYEPAIAAFRQAYARSGDPVLLYNIMLAYDRAGDFEGALEYLEYYRAFAPESERAALSEKEDSLRKRQLRAQTEQKPEEKQPEPAAEAEPEAEPEPAPSRDDDMPPPKKDERKLFTAPVWVFTGVAIAGLGAGTGLGVVALNRRSSADDSCVDGQVCSAGAKSDADASRKLALGADIAFAVGATAGVVAIALIINNAVKRKKGRANTTALVPVRGGAGLSVRF
jgi:tetratricopeptide (TPR) repeat protein